MRSHRGDLRLSNPDWNEYELFGGIRWPRAMLAASCGARPAAAPVDAAAADRADPIGKVPARSRQTEGGARACPSSLMLVERPNFGNRNVRHHSSVIVLRPVDWPTRRTSHSRV